MLGLPGFALKETLFHNAQTEVYRAIRERDGVSLIVRTFSGEDRDSGATSSDKFTSSRYSRLAFTREVLNQLNHPNIVKVIDWIELEKGSESQTLTPFLILEDIQGSDLWRYVEKFEQKQLPVKLFLEIAIQLADALSVIHHQQIIHKDLHPGNIVVGYDENNAPRAQIIDFGLASLLSREQPAQAPPDKLEGLLAYISPEQTGRMNRALDYRSDFYTLGATFYQLLSGDQPFRAEDALGLVYAHMAKVQKPLIELREDVPESVSQIIDKLMNKNAEDRYQSALGLKHDLQQCLTRLESGDESPFALGQQDISGRFNIPQVLYGRDKEVQTLLRHFYIAADGQPQLLAVAGYSGIGKSALVHEVHKPIAAESGLFMQGKFDQFQKNVPYSALKRALAAWLQYVLSLQDDKLQALRAEILDSLGGNARLLVDFMEDFKRVIFRQSPGDLPALPEVGPQENQNRFFLVMQRFIKLISQHRPLVIFIDDLQWADRGTLNLLPKLLSEEGCRLLVIVAYRDNEVDSTHPALQMLEALHKPSAEQAREQTGAIASTLTLEPLPPEQIQHLLEDALHRHDSEVAVLCEKVLAKTAGNPFFSIEFLKTLYTENLLNFDLDARQWTWDIEAIEALDITDNVVELMLGKMQTLPEDTQAMLQVAACVGTYFDIETLAVLAEKDMPEVARALWPALKEGLLLQDGGDWFRGMMGPGAMLGVSVSQSEAYAQNAAHDEASYPGSERRKSPWVPRCKFLHDRMLQAAYESLNEEQRQVAHLKNGRLFLAHYSEAQIEQHLFAIVEQLNHGRDLIEQADEKIRLAELNLRAAEQAKAASAWVSALRHADVGIGLLSENCWQEREELSFNLGLIQVECEFLLGNHQRGQEQALVLLERPRKELFKAKVCYLIASHITALSLNEGIEKALLGLKYCGITIPDLNCIDDETLENEFLVIQSLLEEKGWTIQSHLSRSDYVPEEISLSYRIFARLAAATHIAGNQTLSMYSSYKGFRTVLEHGANEHAIIIYVIYSIACSKQFRYDDSKKSASLGNGLLERYPSCSEAPYALMSLGTLVWHNYYPIDEAIAFQEKAHEIGDEFGDIYMGTLAGYANSIITSYVAGKNLDSLLIRCGRLKTHILKYDASEKVIAANYFDRLLSMLLDPKSADLLDRSNFGEEEQIKIEISVIRPFLEYMKTQHAFWSGNESLAWNAVLDTELSLSMLSGFIPALEQRLISALMACRQTDHAYKEVSESFIQRSLKELTELKGYCPENFTHKLKLLQAEIGFSEGQSVLELRPLYEAAIASANEQGFLQYEALANELLGRMYIANDFAPMATAHLQQAFALYQRWGCTVKLNSMKARYAEYLTNEVAALSVKAASPKRQSEQTDVRSTSDRRSSSRSSSLEGLDLNSVMKSAQVISGELALKSLLGKVIEVIVENAGAQHAALITLSDEQAKVEALLSFQDEKALVNLDGQMLTESPDLPVSLIQYVLRSEQELHLDEHLQVIESEEAEQDTGIVVNDSYFESHRPKSTLCMPVKYRDTTIGALYLENTLSTSAFPLERLRVIKMLLAQAAIAYENARLFTEVNELNVSLEEKVEQRTAELREANAELESFAGSVSHDLRAPLRKIRSFTEILLEDHGHELSEDAHMLLQRVIKGGETMSELVVGLMDLSRMRDVEIVQHDVDLSAMVAELYEEMRERFPIQKVEASLVEGCQVKADARMLRSVMENLINNAWKYSSKTFDPKVSFGILAAGAPIPQGVGNVPKALGKKRRIFYIKDNGAGFDMDYAKELFGTFKRMHNQSEFEGTGIGLATVKRAVEKHGGNIWAHAAKGEGATFYFTLEETL